MPKKKDKSELIKNYGLFWNAEFINWSRKRKNEKNYLVGYDARKKSREATFDKQIAIYVLYDSNLKPVYIGQVGSGKQRLYARLKQHKNTDHLAGRWVQFSWFGLLRVNKGQANRMQKLEKRSADKNFSAKGNILLDQFESILLAGAEPSLNKQGPKWHKAEHFKQKNSKPTIEAEIKEVTKRLEKIEKGINKINTKKKRKRKKK